MSTTVEELASWRGIEPDDICTECDGSGVKTYSSTALWTGGIGGQMLTDAQCDRCWGSGSKSNPWIDLRNLSSIFRKHPEVATAMLTDDVPTSQEAQAAEFGSGPGFDPVSDDVMAAADAFILELAGVKD